MKCRMCESQRLFEFLDLGSTPPADEFRTGRRRFDILPRFSSTKMAVPPDLRALNISRTVSSASRQWSSEEGRDRQKGKQFCLEGGNSRRFREMRYD